MKAKHKSAILLASFQLTLLSGALLPKISLADDPMDLPPEAPLFSDVEAGDSFFIPVQYLKENELIEGYDDGTFRPYQEINRAEALKVLMKAIPNQSEPEADSALPEEETEEFSFADVDENEWYYPYIVRAFNNGIVKGYPDKLFHPEQTINKAEALKIVLLHENPNLKVNVEVAPYTDVTPEDWFAPYARISKERTLFLESRTNGNLDPDETLSRAEFAILIYRLIKSTDNTLFARTTWYGSEGVNWGTASGEAFDVNKMATAHKTLPFGTKIEVTNQANGKSVIVEVNDRGPYAMGVDIDLTQSAFSEIASIGAGIIMTEFKVVEFPPGSEPSAEELAETIEEYGF